MGTPIIGDFISIILSHKLLAYFFLLAILAGDVFFSSLLSVVGINFDGIVGSSIGWALNQVGVQVAPAPSWIILLFIALFPIVIFALTKSGD